MPKVIFLTGTPVLNRPGELYPMVSMIDPDMFPSHYKFLVQYTDGKNNARNVNELRELMKPLMIRRLKKDVKKDLPPIERIFKHTQLSERAQKLYKKVMAGVYEDVHGNNVDITSILAKIQRLKQICSTSKVVPVSDFAVELYDDSEGDSHRKVLIFSQYIFAAEAIHKRLGHESLLITGEIDKDKRLKVVDEFQSNPDKHFLVCTTKAASEALNITAAGSVIFADLMWTPAAHEQAEGRAYGREGDSHGIDSYYFIAEDTIEQWIWELLESKMEMIDEVVDGEGVKNSNKSVLNELLKKMRGR